MSIYVIGNVFFTYKTSCWQVWTLNSTEISSIRNSNLVLNQCSVLCLCSCLTAYDMLIHDRKLSICNVSYHFEDNRVINDILKRFIHSHDEWFESVEKSHVWTGEHSEIKR